MEEHTAQQESGSGGDPPAEPELPGLGGRFPRGRVFVRGFRLDGQYGRIDVLDLDESSWRAFVLDCLAGGPGRELASYARTEHLDSIIPYRQGRPMIQRQEEPPGVPGLVHNQREEPQGS